MRKQWYFDDFFPGQELELGKRTMNEDEIIAFATQFDPQPFHIDREAAAKSIYGGVIASGWHTCATMMRIVLDSMDCEEASMGSPGLDGVRWLQPVRAGDTLQVRYLTKEVRPSTSKPDRGVVYSTWVASNQHGEPVCTIEGRALFLRRPAGAGQ
jgi:acyl dehydratase